MSHFNHLHPSLPGYSYTILPENAPTLRPKVDKKLVTKSETYAAIKSAKKREKSELSHSIERNLQALVEATIVQGISKKLPFEACSKSLNLDPQDPALRTLEERYDRYSHRLSQIPVKKLITKTFTPAKDKENAPPQKAPSPQVLRDYNKRVKPLSKQTSNIPLCKFDWAAQINKGLDPYGKDEEFLKQKGHLILEKFRKLFLEADLRELVDLQRICEIAIDFEELERLLSGTKPKRLTEMKNHPGFIALLNAYRSIFQHAQTHQIELPKTRFSLDDLMTYINFQLNINHPPVDPHLPIFKSITHQIKDEYEVEVNREIDLIRELIHLDFHRIENELRDPETIEKSTARMIVLLKEQKKHTFMRFMQLPYYYSSFCNTANAISKFLSKEDAERGSRYIHLMQELISFQSKSTNPTDQGYRSALFMDLKSNPKEPLESYTKDINIALKEVKSVEQPVEGLERAHTLPFPGALSWGRTKVSQLLAEEEKLGDQDSLNQNIYCPAELYFALKNRTLSQKDFEAHVIEHLEQKTIELQSAPSILHYALLFTHVFYLRLLSETELLPDLINHRLDSLSEWHGAPFKATYKEALGECLVELLQQTKDNNGVHTDDVVNSLNIAYTGPIVVRTKEALEEYQENTPLHRFMRIAIAQIHQSLLQILVEPDQIQALESTWAKKPRPAIQLIRV